MTLRLHDTATHRTVDFQPIDPGHVRLYVCGPTVYDRIHIGNARPLVVFDVLYRLLKRCYRRVRYVRNITDVDDKINARAADRGVAIGALTADTIDAFHADAAALGCLAPDAEPRATEHIGEMIAMIERLIAGGHAYEADGHVLFHVPSWPEYGAFARKDRDEQVAGARVEVAAYKRDPADFVLWKPSRGDEPGWRSPWGRGRPGWHIECSAMSEKHLGADFDIHGGGLDLVFPHHQNEIAQSRCANPGHGFAKYWLHNGYLMSEGEKMSKSLGNFYTVAELLEDHPGEALRLVLLKTHYRAPLDFTKAKLGEAKAELDRFYRALEGAQGVDARDGDAAPVDAALDDDLNTPAALAALHEALHRANTKAGPAKARALADLKARAAPLGLLTQDPEAWFKAGAGLDEAAIEARIAERLAAKRDRDFAKADAIRDALKAEGVLLEDKPGGITEWRRA